MQISLEDTLPIDVLTSVVKKTKCLLFSKFPPRCTNSSEFIHNNEDNCIVLEVDILQ